MHPTRPGLHRQTTLDSAVQPVSCGLLLSGNMSSAVRPDPTELTVLLIFPHRVQLELAVLNGLSSFFHLRALRVPGRTPDKRCQRATEKTNSSKTPGPNHDTQKTMTKGKP